MKYLGIMRAQRYSVNMTDLDAAIFNLVADALRAKGNTVDCIPETEMNAHPLEGYDAVVSMARNVDNLRCFSTTLPCFNSTEGILTCQRKGEVANIFARVGIPQPPYIIRNARTKSDLPFPLWVKNGDSCTQQSADTAYVETEQELNEALDILIERGVSNWLMQPHVVGDLVKFYGVEGTDFFHWAYPDKNHSKLGLEVLNGETKGYAFSPSEMKTLADRAAVALSVPIYGGDCIVSPQGRIHFIDFNDWPSYYCCRDKAAEAIVERITKI